MVKKHKRKRFLIARNESFFFFNLRSRSVPEENTNMLIRLVPVLSTPGVLSTLALFESAPLKPRPIIAVRFAISYSENAPLSLFSIVFL